ncbi:MAG TPA: MFS transporter [Pseudonocardiaceae bacterium]|jgi:MFS family permease|nr:MFS transporter [Pseudonocardiaceae bacterium]
MPSNRTSLGAVFRIAEFRAMWAAELCSVAGDQLARVALSVLVFSRTGSAALTAVTYALTFVPALLGGVLLSGLGDRYPRRRVLIAADLVRAVLVGAVAVPGLPIWVIGVLVAAVTVGNGPFKAAQQALLPTVLTDEHYTAGMAVRNITTQAAQLVGFAGGGALVAAVAPSTGLGLDALSFLVSALLLRWGVRARPSAETVTERPSFLASMTVGARLIWRDPGLRALTALCWLAGFYITPEALAAPYAASFGAGAVAVGLIMASDPVGSVVGGVVFGTWVPEHVQVRVIGVLGILAGLPLLVCALRPGLIGSMACFAVSGMLATAYNIQGTASFVRRLPDNSRAQGSGLLTAGLITVQGIGALLAGLLTEWIGPAHTIAVAGGLGALVAVPIAMAWGRARTQRSG